MTGNFQVGGAKSVISVLTDIIVEPREDIRYFRLYSVLLLSLRKYMIKDYLTFGNVCPVFFLK